MAFKGQLCLRPSDTQGGHKEARISHLDCWTAVTEEKRSGLDSRNLLSYSLEAESQQGCFPQRPLSVAGGLLPSYCLLA